MKYIVNTFFLLLSCSITVANAGSLDYRVGSETFEAYFADAGKGAPLVLLVHDWDGLTDYEIKRAEMLKKQGYSVFAADLFGKGVRPEAIEDRKKMTGALYADRTRMRQLLNAALEEAGARGADRANAVVMGYCFGGTASLEMARAGSPLKGFVSFHGGLQTPEGQDYSSTNGPVLVLHGSSDVHVTLEHFAALGNELEAAGVKHEMITYSQAPHAFTVFGSDRYREDADQKSWKRFLEFLQENLK